MERPKISLIIPAYNEEKYIGRTLESVVKAKESHVRPHLIEVIVVNNCCTDKTEEIAKSFGVEVIFEKERRIAAVRNKGAKSARGEILGFLDADSLITPNMFNSIDEAMLCGEYIGGGANIKFARSSLGLFCTLCITVFPFRWLLGVAGGLIFTSKKTFEELGGFDESLYCAEDSKFVLELKRYGRQKGKGFKIITSDYVITSARVFDKFGDWYYFKHLPNFLLNMRKMARDKEFCDTFWYNIKR